MDQSKRNDRRFIDIGAPKQSRTKSFATESALVETFVTAIRRRCPVGWYLLREVDAGVGVADLVLTPEPDPVTDLQWLSRIQPRLAPLLAPTIASQVSSIQTFMATTGMSRASALRALASLSSLGLAVRDGETVQLRSASIAPFKHVVAIEAKLHAWGRALTQAYRNRQFATQSWVVLDAHCTVSTVAIEAFKQAGVGLATCSTTGQLRFYVKARTMHPVSLQRSWVAQSVIARSQRQILRPLR